LFSLRDSCLYFRGIRTKCEASIRAILEAWISLTFFPDLKRITGVCFEPRKEDIVDCQNFKEISLESQVVIISLEEST
jgi:hypothetical protein